MKEKRFEKKTFSHTSFPFMNLSGRKSQEWCFCKQKIKLNYVTSIFPPMPLIKTCSLVYTERCFCSRGVRIVRNAIKKHDLHNYLRREAHF